MQQIILDSDQLAKLDNLAIRLGSTREEALNQAIDRFMDYFTDKADYDKWLEKKVGKSIKATDEGKLFSASEVDEHSESMIANYLNNYKNDY